MTGTSLVNYFCHFVRLRKFMDVAPTTLYLLGQPIPRDMDGKVLLDIIDEDFKSNNPVRYL